MGRGVLLLAVCRCSEAPVPSTTNDCGKSQRQQNEDRLESEMRQIEDLEQGMADFENEP